jgi:hypothetical protein
LGGRAGLSRFSTAGCDLSLGLSRTPSIFSFGLFDMVIPLDHECILARPGRILSDKRQFADADLAVGTRQVCWCFEGGHPSALSTFGIRVARISRHALASGFSHTNRGLAPDG